MARDDAHTVDKTPDISPALSGCSRGGVTFWKLFTAGLATRRAVAPALLLLATSAAPVGCATLGPSADELADQAVSVRVMSFNIAAGHGDLPRIAEVIRASGAEIVGLQEVDVHWGDRSGFVDQATWLAGALDMGVFFAPIYTFPPADGRLDERKYGLAILSRHPIAAATNHSLSRLSTQSDAAVPVPLPGFPCARIEIGGSAVQVCNTHLDYRSDPATRRLQVGEMIRIIGEGSQPVLLLGDLNAEPDATELGPLFHRLRDAWHSVGNGFTYPADTPIKRIDYILASPHFTIDAVKVLISDASDHRPVVADLTLRSEGRQCRGRPRF
ncbi:MAG: endonuclease/exonuclease/phosphatase family protein [Gemmatimonadetes bacterium]|nr:endonuclease/exonuclease/phosphatase family protein [Gemmatimonadota bacterium]